MDAIQAEGGAGNSVWRRAMTVYCDSFKKAYIGKEDWFEALLDLGAEDLEEDGKGGIEV